MIVTTNFSQCFRFKQNLMGLFCISPYIYNSYILIIYNILFKLRKMQKSPIRFRPHSKQADTKSVFLKKYIIQYLLNLLNCYIIKSDLYREQKFPRYLMKGSSSLSPIEKSLFLNSSRGILNA